MEQLVTFGLTNAVTAALLALAAAVITRFSRRPVLWYALWLVVLLRLLAPPIFAIDLAIPDLGRGTDSPAAAVAVTGEGVVLENSGVSLGPLGLIAVLWAAGAMVVIGFAIAQSIHLRQILIASEPAPGDLAGRVADLCRRLHLRRAPPTVVIDDRVPPMLWAFLGSVRLILPAELLDRLDEKETDTLLAHELAHLSRRDHWVRHLEFAALAIFWWNPVAWWATRRVRRAQESCCDQRVAELLPNHRRAYADCLVETAGFLSGRRLPLGSPARAMADLGQMKGRIRMIMSNRQRRQLALPIRLAAAAILVSVLAVTPMLTAGTEETGFTGEPISLTLKDANLIDVLAVFSKVTDKEILVEPGKYTTITVTVDEVPWDQALANILEEQDLRWEMVEDRIIVRRPEGEPAFPTESNPGSTTIESPVTGELDGQPVFQYVTRGDVRPPEAREKVQPAYPPGMRKSGVSGPVIAELLIDKTGEVREIKVVDSPAPELSAAASQAFEQWTFEPATKDGEPVSVRYIVTVMFRLE